MASQEQGASPDRLPGDPEPLRQRSGTGSLARDLVLALLLKVALVLALYYFLVRPVMHHGHGPAATATAVAGAATPEAHEVRP